MSMAGLHVAASGLTAAQRNIAITGHNMANAEIRGFSRQMQVQTQSFTRNAGLSAAGQNMRVGMGTDWGPIQQIRNEFLDFTYRTEVSRLQFHATIVNIGHEIELLLGELHGAYNFQSVINDMWNAVQELTSHPDGIESRQFFLATTQSFLVKAQDVYNGLLEYQRNLDWQIREAVDDINRIVGEIDRMNRLIRDEEHAGDNANDFRDTRNLLIDKLSEIIRVDTRTAPNGDIVISSFGHELLNQGFQNKIGLRYLGEGFPFVEPVFTRSDEILSSGTPTRYFIPFINYQRGISSQIGNDMGRLHALLLGRGSAPATHMSAERRYIDFNDPANWPQNLVNALDDAILGGIAEEIAAAEQALADYINASEHNRRAYMWGIDHAIIPRVQMNLDRIVNSIVSMLNDTLTGNLRQPSNDPPGYTFVFTDHNGEPIIPRDLEGNTGIPLFIRRSNDVAIDDPQDIQNRSTIFTIQNLMINPALLGDGGHNRIALSNSGALGDTDLMVALHRIWREDTSFYAVDVAGRSSSVQNAYIRFTNQISTDIHEAIRFVDAQSIQVIQADNRRMAIKGVSMEEELQNMLRFQYAFQSAARVLNVIDSMIDRVVNGTGAGRG